MEARGEPFLDRLPSTEACAPSEPTRHATRAHRSTAKRTVASALHSKLCKVKNRTLQGNFVTVVFQSTLHSSLPKST